MNWTERKLWIRPDFQLAVPAGIEGYKSSHFLRKTRKIKAIITPNSIRFSMVGRSLQVSWRSGMESNEKRYRDMQSFVTYHRHNSNLNGFAHENSFYFTFTMFTTFTWPGPWPETMDERFAGLLSSSGIGVPLRQPPGCPMSATIGLGRAGLYKGVHSSFLDSGYGRQGHMDS